MKKRTHKIKKSKKKDKDNKDKKVEVDANSKPVYSSEYYKGPSRMAGKEVPAEYLPPCSDFTNDDDMYPRTKVMNFNPITDGDLKPLADYRFVYADEITNASKLWKESRYDVGRDEKVWVINGWVEGRNYDNP